MNARRRFGLWFSLLLPLMGLGCVGARLAAQGDAAIREGNYRSAYRLYKEASEAQPGEARLLRGVNQLRPYAIAEAEHEARLAIRKGDYKQALGLADYVEKLDKPRAIAMRRFTEKTMAAVLAESIRQGKHKEAYAFSRRCRVLFPQMPGLTARQKSLRTHFYGEATKRTQQGRFEEAHAMLSIVAKNEPEQKQEVARRHASLRRSWGQAIAQKAAAHRNEEQLGAALVLYARANEVDPKANHGQVRATLAENLRQEGAFLLSVDSEADKASELVAALKRRVARNPEVRYPGEDEQGVTMLVHLSPVGGACRQSSTRLERSHNYIAGYREVPNASYERAQRQLTSVESDIGRLVPVVAALHTRWERLDSDYTTCLQRLEPRQRRLDRAEAELGTLRQRYEKLQQRLRRARKARRGRRSKSDRDRLRRLREKIERAQRQVARLRTDYQAQNRVCIRKRGPRDRLSRELRTKESNLRRLRNTSLRLSAELSTMAPTRSVPVTATFRYPVRRVVRRCSTELGLDLRSGWRGNKTITLKSSGGTSDEQHAAYPVHGIAADPLQFRHTDNQLFQVADSANVKKAAKTVNLWLADYYQTMAQKALQLRSSQPHLATQMMVAILLAAPARLDAEATQLFGQHFKHNYGLLRLSSLRGDSGN